MSRRRIAAAAAALAICAICVLVTAALAAPGGQRDRQGGAHHGKPKHGSNHPKEPKHPTPGPPVEARAWGLSDGRSGDVLLSHAGNRRLPIASTTKLMTAYVAMKDLPLGKVVTALPYEAEYGESLMGLEAGERISVRDLLYGLILLSGNDAAHTLAVRAAGTQKKFVAQMNRYAAALGLSNTHYENPIGLDSKENYSSALDLMTLTRHLLEEPAFAKIADSREATLRSTHPVRHIESINQLLQERPWITGVKTGHTWKAEYVLVGAGRKKGTDLISVAIGAPSDEARFADNLELLEYGFRQYSHKRLVKKGKELAEPSIRWSGGELPLRAAHGLKVAVRRGEKVEVDVEAPAQVTGPIRRGKPLGRATVLVDGARGGRVPLVAGRAIPKAGTVDRVRYFVRDNWIPIAVAISAILICAMLFWRWNAGRRRRRRERG